MRFRRFLFHATAIALICTYTAILHLAIVNPYTRLVAGQSTIGISDPLQYWWRDGAVHWRLFLNDNHGVIAGRNTCIGPLCYEASQYIASGRALDAWLRVYGKPYQDRIARR